MIADQIQTKNTKYHNFPVMETPSAISPMHHTWYQSSKQDTQIARQATIDAKNLVTEPSNSKQNTLLDAWSEQCGAIFWPSNHGTVGGGR